MTIPPLTILDCLENNAEARPGDIAFRFLPEEAAPIELTNAELLDQVRSLAAGLSRLAGAGDRALLLYRENEPLDFLAAFLACLAGRLVAVPLHLPPRSRPADRLEAVVRNCDPKLVLMTANGVKALGANAFLKSLNLVLTDRLMEEAENQTFAGPSPGDVAYLQYTSGSTGNPKGVMITHQNLMANERTIQANSGYGPGSVMVSFLPLTHDFGLVGGVLCPLFGGFTSTLLSPSSFASKPARWLQAISTYKATTSGAPNFAFEECVRRVTQEEKRGLDLSSLRVLKNGGEPVLAETLDRFASAFHERGFRPEQSLPCYGLAEATLFVSGGPVDAVPRRLEVDVAALEQHEVRVAQSDMGSRCLVSSGRIGEGVVVVIVDPEQGDEAGPGRVGEIWVQGAGVARGYWEQAEENASTFQAYLPDGRGPFLRTGDFGFLDEDELFITGRLKDMMIILGRNLYPQDVELTVGHALDRAAGDGVAAFEASLGGEIGVSLAIDAGRELWNTLGQVDGQARARDLSERIRREVAREFGVLVLDVGFLNPIAFPRTPSRKVRRKVAALEVLEPVSGRAVVFHPGTAPSTPPLHDASRSRAEADRLISWLRETVGRRYDPVAADERRALPPGIILELGRLGFFGLEVAPPLGLGLSATDLVRVLEQLGAVDPALTILIGYHNGLGLRPICQHARPEVLAELLPDLASGRQLVAFALSESAAGSNPNAIKSRATRTSNGFLLQGEKRWVGLASAASWIVVFAKARSEDGRPLGITAFLVDARSPGVTVGAEVLTMGVRAVPRHDVCLDEVFVPDSHILGGVGAGLEVAKGSIQFCRFGLAAVSIGMIKRAAQAAAQYAGRRRVSTGLLADNAVTLDRLSSMANAAEATGALVHRLARAMDDGMELPAELFAACKILGPELAFEATDRALQVLGGRGYEESSGLSLLLRGARLLRIFEGPTETLQAALGAAGLHDPSTVSRVFALFDAQDLISVASAALERVAAAAGTGVGRGNDDQDENRERQWADHQAGGILAAAVLAAAARRSSFECAAWARERLDDLAARIGPAARTTRTLQAIAGFAADVGVFDTPSTTNDPWLRRDEGSTEAETASARPVTRSSAGSRLIPQIQEALREYLGNSGPFDPDIPLTDLGLSSLKAAAVANWISGKIGIKVNSVELLSGQTLRMVADELEGLGGVSPAPALEVELAPVVGVTIGLAISDAEREAVYRFRYQIYVTQLGRTQRCADHERKWLRDSLDDQGHILAAVDLKGEVVGTVRVNLLRDGSLGEYEALYGLAELSTEARRQTSISTRFMIAPHYWGSSLAVELARRASKLAIDAGITVDYADCNADRLAFFEMLGYRSHRNVIHVDYGEVTVLRLDSTDISHLRNIRSQLLPSLLNHAEGLALIHSQPVAQAVI